MKQDTVAEVRRAIGEVVAARLDSSTNELQTRYAAIDPMLDVLGWSQRDPTQVAVEYSSAKSQVRVDYALLDRKRERVFIEAKAVGANLDEATTRQVAIDPLLKALGWRMRSRSEVSLEHTVGRSQLRLDNNEPNTIDNQQESTMIEESKKWGVQEHYDQITKERTFLIHSPWKFGDGPHFEIKRGHRARQWINGTRISMMIRFYADGGEELELKFTNDAEIKLMRIGAVLITETRVSYDGGNGKITWEYEAGTEFLKCAPAINELNNEKTRREENTQWSRRIQESKEIILELKFERCEEAGPHDLIYKWDEEDMIQLRVARDRARSKAGVE